MYVCMYFFFLKCLVLLLHEGTLAGRGRSCPPEKTVGLTVPFGQIGYAAPWVSLVGQLLMDLLPSLLQVGNLVSWPCMVDIVKGSDVVDDDLICRVEVLVAVDVVSCIQCAASVVPQLCGQCGSQSCTILWRQALSFQTPEGNGLDSTPV